MKKKQHITAAQVQQVLNPTHDYIGRKACGCVVSITADIGDKNTGDFVAEMITNGLTVERVPRDKAMTLFLEGLKCDHDAKQLGLFE